MHVMKADIKYEEKAYILVGCDVATDEVRMKPSETYHRPH